MHYVLVAHEVPPRAIEMQEEAASSKKDLGYLLPAVNDSGSAVLPWWQHCQSHKGAFVAEKALVQGVLTTLQRF